MRTAQFPAPLDNLGVAALPFEREQAVRDAGTTLLPGIRASLSKP